jgi:sigma-E factor negative regulatory protein RseC
MNNECKTRQGGNLPPGATGEVPLWITAANPLGLPLKPGQRVETETALSSTAIQAISTLLPPILGFIAGFFLTALAFPGSGDSARSAGGAFFMFLFSLAFYFYRRKHPAASLPKVVKILPNIS